VLELARLVRDGKFIDAAERIEKALKLGTKIPALTSGPRVDPSDARRST
jgi:hypothetical protein